MDKFLRIHLLILLVICLFIFSCVIERYTIKGSITFENKETSDPNYLSNKIPTIILLKCPKAKSSSNRTVVDEAGYFFLKGYGVVDECKIVVKSPYYQLREVKIGNEHLRDRTYPASPTYEVNINFID